MIDTTYAYYTDIYNGELKEEDFNKYYKKAQYKLDSITDGAYKAVELGAIPESFCNDIRELTCEVVDKLSAVDTLTKETGDALGNAKSIKAGAVSITYASGNELAGSSNSKSLDGNIRDLVIEYCGKYGWGCRWL
jgi:hypothetical protein